MEQLPRLKARISSLEELRDLVRALRALAASHVREAQGALAGIHRYTDAIEDAIAAGASFVPDAYARATAAERRGARVLIVVCSEHGFAGAFNEALLDRAEAELQAGQALAVIGRRGAMLAEERKLAPVWSLPMATHVGGVLGVSRQVAEHLAEAATARIVFAGGRPPADYAVEARDLLPLDPSLLARSRRRSPPLHHLAPEILLLRLAGEYLFAEITRAVMESLASENVARLRVMGAADHNIGDKLDLLHREEHVLRQGEITTELLDVVTGAEAVLRPPL